MTERTTERTTVGVTGPLADLIFVSTAVKLAAVPEEEEKSA